MSRIKKPSGSNDPKTGNDFINKARSAGALVEPSKKIGFTKVSTPKGSTYITPGNEPLDPRTRKNLRHWFRLLGLLTFSGIALAIVDYMWGVLQLPPLW